MVELNPTEEEVAAALAAVSWYLAEEEGQTDQATHEWRWYASAVMERQELPIARVRLRPGWGNIERLRRAGRGGTGITGL